MRSNYKFERGPSVRKVFLYYCCLLVSLALIFAACGISSEESPTPVADVTQQNAAGTSDESSNLAGATEDNQAPGSAVTEGADYEEVKSLLMRIDGADQELLQMGSGITPVLVQIYQDKTEPDHVRKNAIVAIGLVGDARAVDTLVMALEDDNWNTRFYAAEALEKIGDRRAVDPIMTILAGGSWTTNSDFLIAALGSLGDPRALPVRSEFP